MAKKDVELVIKAKDSAASVVDAITKALNEMIGATEDATKASAKSETAFTRFGKSIATLDKAMKGLSSAERVVQQFDKAAQSVAAMDRNLGEAKAKVDALASSMDAAAGATAKFQQDLAETSTRLADEKKNLDQAKTAHAALAKELADAVRERDRLTTAEKSLTTTIGQTEARLAKAQARYAQLGAEVDQAEKPTKRLVASLESAKAAVEKQEGALAQNRQRLAETQTALSGAAQSVEKYTASLAQSETALSTQKGVVAEIKSQFKGLEDATKAAAREQRDLGKEYARAGAELATIEAGTATAKEALNELGQTARRAEDAILDFAQTARGPLAEAFKAQQSTVSRINNVFQDNRKELEALSRLMGQVGVPTKAMADAYANLNRVSNEISTAYQREKTVLKELGAALKETALDSSQLAAQTKNAQSAVSQGAQALGRVAAEASKAATSSQRLVQASEAQARAYASVASGTNNAAQASSKLAGANDDAAESYRRQANASRQAMSWTQRLRGEVLSLISAYGGIYGVINLLQQTITAYQTLEAATSRLVAVNQGDMGAVGADLDFIRRNADRLGIQFGVLANEYTKFSAATQKTVIEGKATRDIFLSIAEAGRVNKLSLDDMGGIFKAVTQIASKGKFQLEELSGQLGDRLPGALNILADGLGVTTEELLDMTKKGEVMSDKLVNFADELDKRYGGALAASLKTTTTALGQLQNAAFQALVQFGKGGFIEGFTQMLRDLTETLKSPEFADFASRISAVFGVLAEAVGVAIKNFRLLVVVGSSFAGFKLYQVVMGLVAAFRAVAPAATGAAAGMVAAEGAAAGAAAAATTATGAVGLLTTAMRLLLSSTGIGLAITGVSIALGYWATRATEATSAMDAHRRIVDQVKNGYEEADGKAKNWAETIKNVTLTEAVANVQRLTQALQDARDKTASLASGVTANARAFGGLFGNKAQNAQAFEIDKLVRAYKRGELTINDFKAALDKIGQSAATPAIKSLVERLLESAESSRDAAKAVDEANLVVKALSPNAQDAQKAMDDLNGGFKEATGVVTDATDAAESFNDTMQKIKELIPGVSDTMKENKEITEGWYNILKAISELNFSNLSLDNLSTIYKGAQALYQRSQEQQFGDVSKSLAGFTDGLDAATALVKQREDLILTARWDVNHYRVGYGSDTVTLSDNTIQKVTKGMTIGVADANRDLARRVRDTMAAVRDAVGADRFAQLNPQQQAVLTSLAYNYGTGELRNGGDLSGVVEAVRTGTTEGVVNAIRARATDNGGVNANRRNQEAFIYGNGQFDVAAGERAAALEKQKREDAEKFHQAQIDSNTAAQQELALKDLDLIKREQGKAIAEAELAAKKAGTTLTEQERQNILANVEAKYREQAAQEAATKSKQAAADAEQRVTDLVTKRTELENQLKIYQQQGNTEMVASTQAAIQGVNSELEKAIDNAIAMYQALGGAGADAAIAKLQTIKLETANVSTNAQTAFLDWKRVGELFASGLTNAFDRFARAVAEGKSVGEAAAEAFLQFAADFLIEIGKMIIQQAILNALRGLGGVFAGIGTGHTGGVVGSKRIGSGNATRRLDPGIFATAPRFHSGGLPGLKPNEVPAVLKKGEEVLNENDPRNILNGGAGLQTTQGNSASGDLTDRIRIVNAFDAASVVSEGLSSGPGEKTLMNWVKQNRSTIKDVLG